VFNILKQTSTLEDSCFYSSLPAEAVMHIAILNCEPFQFMLRYEQKSKVFETNIVYIGTVCGVKSYNNCLKSYSLSVPFFPDTVYIRFLWSWFMLADKRHLRVGREFRCKIYSRRCWYLQVRLWTPSLCGTRAGSRLSSYLDHPHLKTHDQFGPNVYSNEAEVTRTRYNIVLMPN